jgi:hypothetical protein
VQSGMMQADTKGKSQFEVLIVDSLDYRVHLKKTAKVKETKNFTLDNFSAKNKIFF